MSLRYKEALSFGFSFLRRQHSAQSNELDAAILLAAASGLTKTDIYIRGNELIDDNKFLYYQELLDKRASDMPVAYIINQCEFMGLDFFVDENVLIPRPDTEILTEEAIKYISSLKTKDKVDVLDMCTGSGCVGISISHYCHNAFVDAVDNSIKALYVANKNAAAHKINDRMAFICSDMFSQVSGCYDIIIANPPYIPSGIISTLSPNVRVYEPFSALNGGSDGLDFYRIIARESGRFLNSHGRLYMEIGYDQGPYVLDIFSGSGFYDPEIINDFAGLNRVIKMNHRG